MEDNLDGFFDFLTTIFSNEEVLNHFEEFNSKMNEYVQNGMSEEEAYEKIFEEPDFRARAKVIANKYL